MIARTTLRNPRGANATLASQRWRLASLALLAVTFVLGAASSRAFLSGNGATRESAAAGAADRVIEIARAQARDQLGLDGQAIDFMPVEHRHTDRRDYVHLLQTLNGVPIDGAYTSFTI